MFRTYHPKEDVQELKNIAETLIQYSPPKYPLDNDISDLKSRNIIIDGIKCSIHYSILNHGDLKPYILTISPNNVPFLPFYILCKIPKLFFDTENITFSEYNKRGTKIYSWLVLLKKGTPVDVNGEVTEKINYRGFNFYLSNKDEDTSDISGI